MFIGGRGEYRRGARDNFKGGFGFVDPIANQQFGKEGSARTLIVGERHGWGGGEEYW